MKRVLIFTFAATLNVLLWLNAVAPRYVTWAEVAPKDVTCSTCASPDVQEALAKATAVGRSQIIGTGHTANIALILALLNIALVGAVLFIPALTSQCSRHRTGAADFQR